MCAETLCLVYSAGRSKSPTQTGTPPDAVVREVGRLWLQSSQMARKEAYYQASYSALLRAEQAPLPSARVERCKWLWAQGLHQEIKPSAEVPFWMSEVRKRVFGVTYICDKGTSNFLGRPPRLQRKYCSMQLPLDLEPRQLRLPPALLEREVDKLDENGWNTDDAFTSTAYIR